MFTQFGLEDMTRLLHEWVAVSAASKDAGFEASGAVADLACGDASQQVFTNPSQCFVQQKSARMHCPAAEHELTGARETDRTRLLVTAEGR